MEGESEGLSCVLCSAQVTHTDSQDKSSNYLSFSQFCGELEKCSEQSDKFDKPFNANQFFHNVDTAANYLLICFECQQLVNEKMKSRINLEKWEMEVLKLQIELLMKLKELQKCSDNYFSKMNRIYDKVKNSVEDDLEEEGIFFGAMSLRKDEVNLFREKILDVFANLALFRDDIKDKPLKSPSPSLQPDQPALDAEEETETADHFPPIQINIKDNPTVSIEDNISSLNDGTYQDHDDDDFNANEEEANSSDDSSESKDEQINEPKVPKKKTRKKTDPKISRIFDNLPPLPFPPAQDTPKHKQLLNQNILIPPSTSPLQSPVSHDTAYTFMLQSYPWNYSPTSDTISTIPITVMEPDKEKSISLNCSTCHFTTVYKHNNQRNIFGLVRRMFEHVVSSHLDGFKCPSAQNNCVRKMGTLKVLCKHLRRSHGNNDARKDGLFHCSICGKGLGSLTDCLYHETTHKERKERDYVTCDTCGTTLLRRSLPQHTRLFCGKRVPRTVCQICGVSFSRERTIRDHMLRKHAGEEEKRWECEVCGKKYGLRIDLKNHKISKHGIYPGGMGRECRKGCGKKFTWQSSLCKHEDKCDGIRGGRKNENN